MVVLKADQKADQKAVLTVGPWVDQTVVLKAGQMVDPKAVLMAGPKAELKAAQ
jgi:hypothetical protein